jgi:hypothetical protein
MNLTCIDIANLRDCILLRSLIYASVSSKRKSTESKNSSGSIVVTSKQSNLITNVTISKADEITLREMLPISKSGMSMCEAGEAGTEESEVAGTGEEAGTGEAGTVAGGEAGGEAGTEAGGEAGTEAGGEAGPAGKMTETEEAGSGEEAGEAGTEEAGIGETGGVVRESEGPAGVGDCVPQVGKLRKSSNSPSSTLESKLGLK